MRWKHQVIQESDNGKRQIPNAKHPTHAAQVYRIIYMKYISTMDLNKAFCQIPVCQLRSPGKFANSPQLTALIVLGRGLIE